MESTQPQHTVLATYSAATGKEEGLRKVLNGHWTMLRELGMVEAEPAQLFRREDGEGAVTFVEIFTWKPGAAARAHQHPEVAATWERITQFVATEDGRAQMSFRHYARV
jgi:hypothetical protein